MGDKAINLLCKEMNSNNSINYLNISSNKITDEGAKAISEMLRINTTLNVFFMRWN